MVRALENPWCCNEINAMNEMSNQCKCSTRGSKIILWSNLNAYYNVKSFIGSIKYRTCKQRYHNHMAKLGVMPLPNAELDIPIN